MQDSEEKEASAKEDVLDATASKGYEPPHMADDAPEENKPPPRVDDERCASASKLQVSISDQDGSSLGSGTVNDSDDSEQCP